MGIKVIMGNSYRLKENFSQRKKCPYWELFWSVFSPNAAKCGPE